VVDISASKGSQQVRARLAATEHRERPSERELVKLFHLTDPRV